MPFNICILVEVLAISIKGIPIDKKKKIRKAFDRYCQIAFQKCFANLQFQSTIPESGFLTSTIFLIYANLCMKIVPFFKFAFSTIRKVEIFKYNTLCLLFFYKVSLQPFVHFLEFDMIYIFSTFLFIFSKLALALYTVLMHKLIF